MRRIEVVAAMLSVIVGFSVIACSSSVKTGAWVLRTDDTALRITVRGSSPEITLLGPAKTNANWLAHPVAEKFPASLIVQGSPVTMNWKYAGASYDKPNGKLVLRFVNSSPAVELQSLWQARPGRGPVEHWLTIANHTSNPITVGHQDSLVFTVEVPKQSQAWWIKRGGSNATKEGGTIVRNLDSSFDQILLSNPEQGDSPVPWMALQAGDSRGLYVGWEFSGIGRIHAAVASGSNSSQNPGTEQVTLQIGNVPEFKTDVAAHSTFLVPAAFVGTYLGDIDDGSYSLHRFVLDKLLPKRPKDYPYPTLAYNLYLDAGGQKATQETVLQKAALAREMGFETFLIDAMWFPQSGDWRWDPARFPHGVEPIEQYVHQHDMKLGLWFAYTHGSDSNDPNAVNIAKHPDWFTQTVTLDHKSSINWKPLIDLGDIAARRWVEQSTERAVSDYKIDDFKTDYSPIVTECQRTDHLHHYGVDVSYWSTLGYYEVQDKLLRQFPNLMLEGCSGGGHIKDFGDIEHVHNIVTTDTLSALPDRQSVYDSTFAFPPAVLMAYTYENHYNRTSDTPEPFLWRSAMMSAWQIDPTDSAVWTAEQKKKVKRSTDIYKSWIRPILQDVQVHHILPRPDGQHWDGMFYWSPSLKRGTLYIFRPDNLEASKRIALKRGLIPNMKYRVHAEDGSTPDATYSGAELMNTGLTIRLPGKYASDLIYLEEASSGSKSLWP